MSDGGWSFGAFGIAILLSLFLMAIMPSLSNNSYAFAPQNGTPDSLGRVPGDHILNIGIWIINVYSFEYRTGSYTFDFYAYFFWTDKNITDIDWYVMNGLPSSPATKVMVSNGTSDGYYFEIWRVREDLSVPLEPKGYPFDEVDLPISIEVLPHGYSTEFNWMPQESGVDPGFKIVGWNVKRVDYTIFDHHYPLNSTLPQAVMTLAIAKSPFVAFMQTIFPPLIFCVVSAFSYLFRMDEEGNFGLRIGLNTSMLITAVLFNISVTSNIPPISEFNLYSAFITAVMSFLSMTLRVTIIGYVEWKHQKRAEQIMRINIWGAVVSLALPLLIFLVFFIVNG